MPPKTAKGGKGGDAKAGGKSKQMQGKKKEGGGGKAKKKKWSKGKVRDKLNNAVLMDKATYDKMYKEAITYKLITPSVLSERLKIRASLAKAGLKELVAKGLIKLVVHHSSQIVYTRATKAEDEEGGDQEQKKPETKSKESKQKKKEKVEKVEKEAQ